MSNYTTEVRFICESYAGLSESVGLSGVNEVIAKAREKVFDFAFPIYDENYRGVLESKILKHYYTREIGAETVGLWKLWLDTRLNEIMPYYNQLYKSAMIQFDPMLDVDITTNRDVESGGSREDRGTNSLGTVGSNNGSNSSDSWNYYSDTPQGGINGLSNQTYLTNATHDTNSGSNTNNFNSNSTGRNDNDSSYTNTEEYVEHIRGKRSGVSYSKMLKEYRETMLNIDMQIIDSLSDLFMGLW